jgi:hypothetical protein
MGRVRGAGSQRIFGIFGGSEKYKQSISEWLKNLDIENLGEFALD